MTKYKILGNLIIGALLSFALFRYDPIYFGVTVTKFHIYFRKILYASPFLFALYLAMREYRRSKEEAKKKFIRRSIKGTITISVLIVMYSSLYSMLWGASYNFLVFVNKLIFLEEIGLKKVDNIEFDEIYGAAGAIIYPSDFKSYCSVLSAGNCQEVHVYLNFPFNESNIKAKLVELFEDPCKTTKKYDLERRIVKRYERDIKKLKCRKLYNFWDEITYYIILNEWKEIDGERVREQNYLVVKSMVEVLESN